MSYFWIGRIYQLCKNLYFDDYMKAMGAGLVNRKMVNSSLPIFRIDYDAENEWYILSEYDDYMQLRRIFKFDEEFEDLALYYHNDSSKAISMISMEGLTSMIHVQKFKKIETTIIREFSETGMIATYYVGRIKSVRTFKNYEAKPVFGLPLYFWPSENASEGEALINQGEEAGEEEEQGAEEAPEE